MAAAVTPAQLKHYHEEGYIVLRGAFSKQRIKALIEGLNRLMDDALASKTSIHWFDAAKRLPMRIGHMLHPDKYQPEFAAWLDEDLDGQIQAFLGGPARHSLFGMLAGGNGMPYLQGWHHDLGKPGAPDEVEYMQKHHGRFVQFNAPLREHDRYLHIVPRSHNRASTPDEIRVSQRAGFTRANDKVPVTPEEVKAIEAWDAQDAMPGAMVVEMEPGDIAFYNANLWHRGWNAAGNVRWTMHSAFWKPVYSVMSHEHGQREAMLTPGHMNRMPPITRLYIQRYLDSYPEGKPKSLLEV